MSTLKVNNIESYTAASAVTVKDSLTVTGSVNQITSNTIIFGNLLPTSSLGLDRGQLYRTGSNFDEIKITL